MPPKSSKLCPSFPKVMQQTSSVLEYFLQYMESVSALHLVQFWLIVETFRVHSHSQPRTPQLGENARCLDSDKVSNGSPLAIPCSKCGTMETGVRYGPGTSKDAPGTDEETRNVGGGRHRGLQRRDTENHKYCDCRIDHMHQQPTPPLTPKHDSRADNKHGLESGGIDKTRNRDCEYPSPRLKKSNPSADVLASMNLPPDVFTPKDGALTSPLDTRNLIPGWYPDTVSSKGLSDVIPDTLTPNHLPTGLKDLPPPPTDQIPDQHARPDQHPAYLLIEMDALGIYSKYLALNATNLVEVTAEIRQRVEVSICPEDGVISNSCFNEAQEFVYEVMEKRYYPGFLRSSYLCKYQLDYIAGGGLNLVDFLLGENALSFFTEFMEQESSSSLLQFWLTAENFHHQLSSDRSAADMSDAIAIYDRYFSLQATAPLNMEDSVRLDVENRICDEHGPRADSYLRPQLVAFHTMNEVHFPVFIGSSIYLRFLNELVHTLNRDEEATSAGGREHAGLSPDNTSNENVLKLSQIIMGKDLDDPNSLWERPVFLLRLGHMNEFGEYVSEIDPIPMKSSKRDYSWTVSARILRNHRKEEDLAMKLAKNIIREVMNCVSSDDTDQLLSVT